MSASGLKCITCGRVYPVKDCYFCDECGGILDVVYETPHTGNELLSQSFAMMPVTREEVLSLGCAATPLIHAHRLGVRLGLDRLYFKCEMNNATGSFKDRPVSVAISMAKKFGYRQVVAASSGNAAAATAACAARQGLECIIVIPAATPDEKVKQTSFYGAKVYKVDGPYSNSYQVALELAAKHGVYNVTTTFLNPYAMEGDKLVGYEIYETLGQMPDWVYIPVGAGPLLGGVYKGLKEYAAQRGITCPTHMVAMQAQGNQPIATAFACGDEHVCCNHSPNTIAGGIADGLVGYEQDGTYTLRLCRESNGAARSVSDAQIRLAQELLATLEGLFVEPSAAASVAGILCDAREGRIGREDLTVAVLTGHGLKDMGSLSPTGEIRVVQKASDIAETLYEK